MPICDIYNHNRIKYTYKSDTKIILINIIENFKYIICIKKRLLANLAWIITSLCRKMVWVKCRIVFTNKLRYYINYLVQIYTFI